MTIAESLYQNHLANRYTFANLPSASAFGYGVAWVTDVGVGPGSMWQCNGSVWTPVNGSCVIAMSGNPLSSGNDTTEDTLATVSIPANLLGANGQLEVKSLWNANSSVSTKTIKIYFGTNTASGIQYLNSVISGSTVSEKDERLIANRNSTNSQIGGVNTATAFGTAGGNLVSSTITTLSIQNIIFTGQKTSASDVLTLQCYKITLNRTGS